MLKEFFSIFRPKIPNKIQLQLEDALPVLTANPMVKEIRLFGSAQNGGWDPRRSDIDVAVIIVGNNTDWSAYSDQVTQYYIDPEIGESLPVKGETSTRRAFRNSVKLIAPKIHLAIATEADLVHMKQEGGDFQKIMLRGRLLYKE